MKRGRPLRRTPLARGIAQLSRKAPLRRVPLVVKTAATGSPERRARLRQVSRKRAAENRVRAAVIAATWPQRPRCACGCGRLADDVHEILSRARGGSITDPANMAPLARYCHDKATNEDPRFYGLGLVIHSWEAV